MASSSLLPNSLAGKVAIITGASSGIGFAIAKRLAEQGAKLSLAARRVDKLNDLKKEIQTTHPNVTVVVHKCDVKVKSDVFQLVEATEKELGPVDIMVNNAGVMLLAKMTKLKVDEWEQMIDINVKGVLYGVSAVLPKMLERKSGDIVNISSDAGRKVFPTGTVYCASKWAVEAITQGLRQEIAGSGVRCLSIQPGATTTELGTHCSDEECIASGKAFASAVKFLEADDVARAVVFALGQPRTSSINEILIRPEQQGM